MSPHGHPATLSAEQSVHCVPAGTGLAGRSERAEPPSSGMREPAWARTPFQGRPARAWAARSTCAPAQRLRLRAPPGGPGIPGDARG